jgi:multiple sugar transport system substrate-binding protein
MTVIGRRTSGILMAGVLLLAACGGSAPSSSAPTDSAGTSPGAAASAAGGEPVTLTLWIFEGEEGILPKFKEGFEAANPNVTLEITLIPEDLYATKLDTAFAAGSPPDIAYMFERKWLQAGHFLALNDVLASNNIDVARFSQGPLDACQFDGQLFCIGSYLGQVVLLYDKQAFDEAGLPYPNATEPMSVDEYAEIAATLTKPNPDLAQRVWGAEVAPTYWWMDPRTIYSEDGRTIAGLVDDDATIHSWDVLGKMAQDGVGLTAADQEAAALESTDLLATHQLAMAIEDNLAFGELQASGVDVGIAPVPVEQEGDQVWVPTWMDSWGVTTRSAHPNEALALVAWIATEGNEVRADAGTPPLDVQLARDMDWAAGAPERVTLVELAAAARPGFFIPGFWGNLASTLEDSFLRIVEAGDAGGVLREAAPILQEDLDQEWLTWESIE